MSPMIVMIAVFIGAAALIGGLALLLRGEGATVAEDRLDVLTGAATPSGGKNRAGAEPSLLAQPLDNPKNLIASMLSRFGGFQRFLDQANSPLSASRLVAASVGAGGLAFVVCVFAGAPLALAPVAAATLGVAPLGWLFFRRKRRLAMFGRQIPEALELVSRALRAGHSLASGINLVGEEMDEPIRSEFARVYDEQNFGIPLEEALETMTERIPNLDVRFFVTAVVLQRQTGGDLAEILDKIGYLVRERFKVWGQIQALTGEGRLSGIVLLALPPVLFLAMWRLNPDYCMILFTDPLGHQMLAVAAIMQVLGALVIRKIVNIKV